MLLKLNLLGLTVGPSPIQVDAQSMKSWLELARRSLYLVSHTSFIADKFKAEQSMSASASDLKSAYVHFTRVAVILDEIIPQHPKYERPRRACSPSTTYLLQLETF
jgi:hypothetical protein